MSRKLTVGSLLELGLFFCISYAFFPIIRVTPTFVRGIWRLIPEVCLILIVLISNNPKIRNTFWLISVFGIFLALARSLVYANGIVDNYWTNIVNSVLYWHMIVYAFCIFNYLQKEKAVKLLKMSVRLIILTCITTSIGNFLIPEMSRYSSNFLENDFIYYKYNIGTYAFIYAIIFMFINLFFVINKNNNLSKHEKRVDIICLILIVPCIVFSQFMTALVLVAIAWIYMRFLFNKPLYTKILAVVLGMLVIFFMQPIMILLLQVTELFGFGSLTERIGGLSSVLLKQGAYGDVSARFHLYQISLQYFFKNPLFGLAGYRGFERIEYHRVSGMLNSNVSSVLAVGQHSDLIDLLGGNGLIVVAAFILIVMYYYRSVQRYSCCDKTFGDYIKVALLIYFIYGIFDHSFSCLDVAISLFSFPAIVYKGYVDDRSDV